MSRSTFEAENRAEGIKVDVYLSAEDIDQLAAGNRVGVRLEPTGADDAGDDVEVVEVTVSPLP